MFNGSTETKNDGLRNVHDLNDLNPSFIKNLFNKRNNINRRKNDHIIHTHSIYNSITFGTFLKHSS